MAAIRHTIIPATILDQIVEFVGIEGLDNATLTEYLGQNNVFMQYVQHHQPDAAIAFGVNFCMDYLNEHNPRQNASAPPSSQQESLPPTYEEAVANHRNGDLNNQNPTYPPPSYSDDSQRVTDAFIPPSDPAVVRRYQRPDAQIVHHTAVETLKNVFLRKGAQRSLDDIMTSTMRLQPSKLALLENLAESIISNAINMPALQRQGIVTKEDGVALKKGVVSCLKQTFNGSQSLQTLQLILNDDGINDTFMQPFRDMCTHYATMEFDHIRKSKPIKVNGIKMLCTHIERFTPQIIDTFRSGFASLYTLYFDAASEQVSLLPSCGGNHPTHGEMYHNLLQAETIKLKCPKNPDGSRQSTAFVESVFATQLNVLDTGLQSAAARVQNNAVAVTTTTTQHDR